MLAASLSRILQAMALLGASQGLLARRTQPCLVLTPSVQPSAWRRYGMWAVSVVGKWRGHELFCTDGVDPEPPHSVAPETASGKGPQIHQTEPSMWEFHLALLLSSC